ncbi:MAG: LemA family protein [bacterium]
MTLIIVLAAVVLFILIFAGIYNGLVRVRNQVRNAWAQIDVQLKRRHDLIPNLVETVKGYAKHERDTLDSVTQARAAAQKAAGAGVEAQAQAERKLSSSLMNLFAVAENYPDLKANQNFLSLQEELASTENKIGFARQFYNDAVMNYNVKIQSVPTNVVASMFGFREEKMFEIEDAREKEVPKVSFS